MLESFFDLLKNRVVWQGLFLEWTPQFLYNDEFSLRTLIQSCQNFLGYYYITIKNSFRGEYFL
jgi:hypothetical protein